MFGIPHELILYVHVASLSVAGCGIIVADKIGFSWFRGKVKTLHANTLHILHEVMGGALALMIASGLLLFWPYRAYLVEQPAFYVKMSFVAVLVLNSFFIDRLMSIATRQPFASLTQRHKLTLMLSGGLSLACWVGTTLTALILFGFFS